MKKEFLQPFLHASLIVTETFFKQPVEKKPHTRTNSLDLNKEIIIAIGLTGTLSGIFLMGFTESDGVALANQVLTDKGIPPASKWNSLTESVFKEYGKQVAGFALNLFEANSYLCKMTAPRLISADQVNFFKLDAVHYFIKLPLGRLEVKIHVEQTENHSAT